MYDDISDRRPGYVRQQEEPIQIICECGQPVVEVFGELHHVGDCKNGNN